MRELRGRVAFVTGASSGIGRQLARDLAGEGMRLALVARSADGLAETARLCGTGAEALCLPCDVSVRDEVERAAGDAVRKFGRVDLLVNNAGLIRYRSFLDTDLDELELLMRVNFLGMVYCTKALLPGMVARRVGHVVNMSSIAGRIGSFKTSAYCASKFAISGFSESLYYELRGSGVGLTTVHPGMIDTNLWSHESIRDFPRSVLATRVSPSCVTRAIVKAVRKERVEITVPAVYRVAVAFKMTFPGFFRWSQSQFVALTSRTRDRGRLPQTEEDRPVVSGRARP